MSVTYQAVLWNRQKKIYDRLLWGLIALYLLLFSLINVFLFSEITAETLIIRATGSLAIVILHIILAIGPLSRINRAFLPLLYNRRHLGVSMFLIALIHGAFSIIQFHALGDINPILSLFLSNANYDSLVNFPFQILGFFALLILFLMAATSHDFWLKNLSPKVWKRLHMMVYLAYFLIVMHVMLGMVQTDKPNGIVGVLGLGMIGLIGLHLSSALKERKSRVGPGDELEGFYEVCALSDIKENRAKIIHIHNQNIAIFKYNGRLSAIHNVCKHQGGPLGEGKIVDGCITCPWHGYQYLPGNGSSPPPFTEKVHTYDIKLVGTKIFVNPKPYPEGTERPPVLIKK